MVIFRELRHYLKILEEVGLDIDFFGIVILANWIVVVADKAGADLAHKCMHVFVVAGKADRLHACADVQ